MLAKSIAAFGFVGFAAVVAVACSCEDNPPATRGTLATGRSFVDVPGTLRMHTPKARFFRLNGDVRRFRAVVGFDPAIHALERKYSRDHVAATKMGFRAYAEGKLVADTGLLSPGDGTRVIDVDTRALGMKMEPFGRTDISPT